MHNCAQEVLAIGTPAIWWASIPALLVCLVWWLLRRDWRAGAVLAGVAAGWLPWFWFAWHDHRTEFFFYAVVFDPFLVIALTLCLGLIIGPARASIGRRAAGAGRGRRVPARRRLPNFCVHVSGVRRQDHSVHVLAGPDVVSPLDLSDL